MSKLGGLLYRFRLKDKLDPYSEFKKIRVNGELNDSSDTNKNKVLIVPYRVNGISNLFEGNLAAVLKSKGFEVDTLLCGGKISHCDHIDGYRLKWPRCKMCVYEQRAFVEAFSVGSFYVSDNVSEKGQGEIEAAINAVDVNRIADLTFRAVPIEKPLIAAIQLYKKSTVIDPLKDKAIINGFLRTIFSTIIALDKYFQVNEVDFVLLSHGVYSTWGTVLEYCLKHNINCVTWGREYNGAGIKASHNDSYLNEPMYEKNSVWDKAKLTSKQRKLALDYLNAKIGLLAESRDYVNYHQGNARILPESVIREKLCLKDEDKIIGLFPNIPWDGQTFRPAKIFENINAWVFETIEHFLNKEDVVLIIRSHPAELHDDGGDGEIIRDVITSYFGRLPPNIIVLPADSEISSLSVASISYGCVLYGSTVGYETTHIRTPTILASDFFYSNKDISFDPQSKAEYFDLIGQGYFRRATGRRRKT